MAKTNKQEVFPYFKIVTYNLLANTINNSSSTQDSVKHIHTCYNEEKKDRELNEKPISVRF
ncbi:MAG: hypothetical protein ACRCZO_17530, partial [Cetobacterium sp.]